jgi:hypothetical protein
VVAWLRGTAEISDRSEIRVYGSNEPIGPVVDVAMTPGVNVRIRSRQGELTASYSLRLAWTASQRSALHRALLSAAWHDRLASISLYEHASYGREFMAGFAPDPTLTSGPPRLDALPAAGIIDYASSRTGILTTLRAPRRWVLSLLCEYALSGGADREARAVIPFQTGLRGEIGALYALSRRDRLASTIGASRALFSSGPDDIILYATESWRRSLGRNTDATLSGGAGFGRSRAGAAGSMVSSAYPIVEAGLAHRIPRRRIDALLSFRLSPVVDRSSGHVDERLEATAAASWNATRALAIQGQLGALQAIPWTKPGASAFVLDGLAVSYRVSQFLQCDGGARILWASTRGVGASPPRWDAFVGATLTAPPIPF